MLNTSISRAQSNVNSDQHLNKYKINICLFLIIYHVNMSYPQEFGSMFVVLLNMLNLVS